MMITPVEIASYFGLFLAGVCGIMLWLDMQHDKKQAKIKKKWFFFVQVTQECRQVLTL